MPTNNYDDFSRDILGMTSVAKYYIYSPQYDYLGKADIDAEMEVNSKPIVVNVLRFFDKDCRVINNKFNKHLLANIDYFNIILIDDSLFEIDSTSDYYEILSYVSQFPNVRLTGGKINFSKNPLALNSKYSEFIEIVNHTTANKYNNDFVESQTANLPELPNKLLEVLGISDIYSDLQRYKTECKDKQAKIVELETELENHRKKQKIVDEIIRNSAALASLG